MEIPKLLQSQSKFLLMLSAMLGFSDLVLCAEIDSFLSEGTIAACVKADEHENYRIRYFYRKFQGEVDIVVLMGERHIKDDADESQRGREVIKQFSCIGLENADHFLDSSLQKFDPQSFLFKNIAMLWARNDGRGSSVHEALDSQALFCHIGNAVAIGLSKAVKALLNEDETEKMNLNDYIQFDQKYHVVIVLGGFWGEYRKNRGIDEYLKKRGVDPRSINSRSDDQEFENTIRSVRLELGLNTFFLFFLTMELFMKTLQKTLRTLTLVSLATTSLMAMEPTRHQQATYSLATDLLQCYILKKPERILQSIQTLSRTHDILKCSDIVTAALAEANISLEKIVDENGNTMLHLACSNDSSVNTVNIILTAEQNENLLVNLLSAKNKEGFTALDLATTRNQQETIRILLDTADNFLHIEETHNLVSCYQSQKVTTSRRSANNNDFSIEMGRSAINGHPQRINKINGQLPCNIAHPTQYNPSTNVPRFNESNRDDIGNVSGSSKNLMENK